VPCDVMIVMGLLVDSVGSHRFGGELEVGGASVGGVMFIGRKKLELVDIVQVGRR